MPNDLEEYRSLLLGNFLVFCQEFFPIIEGRPFIIEQPIGRESHHKIFARAFQRAIRLEQNEILLNCPPGSNKTTFCVFFIAWALARFPDCRFIYSSYSYSLAQMKTEIVRNIMMTSHYVNLFGVTLRKDTKAKGHFRTQQGGEVFAAGMTGTITGIGAGIQGLDRFGGALIMDDMHKVEEVHSDLLRKKVLDTYQSTLLTRIRNPGKTPIICIGHRLHEDDLSANLIAGFDGRNWDPIIIKGVDAARNYMRPDPEYKTMIDNLREHSPYVFSAQYQQLPQDPSTSLYKIEDFLMLDLEPANICATFYTVDTAETEKTYNDPTVFSFWGLYEKIDLGVETGEYGLHCLDCVEIWVEPKDLEFEFNRFHAGCLRHPIKPILAGIEKKSMGTYLCSVLKGHPLLKILEIDRTSASGSKADRFISIQPNIAQKQISFTRGAKHVHNVIKHMTKINAAMTHKNDDIADTVYDAIKIGLIDKVVLSMIKPRTTHEKGLIKGYQGVQKGRFTSFR